jgi:hypothetical protein
VRDRTFSHNRESWRIFTQHTEIDGDFHTTERNRGLSHNTEIEYLHTTERNRGLAHNIEIEEFHTAKKTKDLKPRVRWRTFTQLNRKR